MRTDQRYCKRFPLTSTQSQWYNCVLHSRVCQMNNLSNEYLSQFSVMLNRMFAILVMLLSCDQLCFLILDVKDASEC